MIITDIQVQKKNKNMRSIFIDDKYCLSLEDIDVYKLKIKIGDIITDLEVEDYKKNYEYSKARDRALRFVSYKKRSENEVYKKLQQYEYDDDIISKIISKLYELNYLNDEDYTNSFLKEKMKLRPSGKILLKYELKNRGIDEKLIDNCLDEIGTNEFDMAFEICEKKFNNLKLFDQKEKQKIYSFLQRRGFNSDTIINVITKLKNIKDGKYEI